MAYNLKSAEGKTLFYLQKKTHFKTGKNEDFQTYKRLQEFADNRYSIQKMKIKGRMEMMFKKLYQHKRLQTAKQVNTWVNTNDIF